MICIYELDYELSPNGSDTQSLFSVTRSPGLHLQLKDSHSRSHHKDHGWPWVLSRSFLLISLELAAVPREQRGVAGRGEEETQQRCPRGSWMVSTSFVHQPLLLLLWTSEPVHLVPAPSLLYFSCLMSHFSTPTLPTRTVTSYRQNQDLIFHGLPFSANSKPDIH